MVPGSCETPHMKYCRKEDAVFYHTVMTNTKTKTKTKCLKDPIYAIFFWKAGGPSISNMTSRPDQTLHSRGPNSWTCILVEMYLAYASALWVYFHCHRNLILFLKNNLILIVNIILDFLLDSWKCSRCFLELFIFNFHNNFHIVRLQKIQSLGCAAGFCAGTLITGLFLAF